MSVTLPPPVAAYFTANNARDAEGAARCFTADAVVHDEGKEMRGSAAIKDWERRVFDKYGATMTPTSASGHPGKMDVVAQVAGNFDGSPLPLIFHFTLAGALISALEISA